MAHWLEEPETHWTKAPQRWNEITSQVIGAAIEVHRALGPGLPEKIYEHAFCHELQLARLRVTRQCPVQLRYKDQPLPELYVDTVVEDLVAIELKAVEKVSDLNLAQLMSYMRAGGFPLGLLINFNAMRLKDGVFRRINGDPSRFQFPS
jgi:GxxExxY protein